MLSWKKKPDTHERVGGKTDRFQECMVSRNTTRTLSVLELASDFTGEKVWLCGLEPAMARWPWDLIHGAVVESPAGIAALYKAHPPEQ